MKKTKSERGSISVFVIVAFIFCMTILMNVYWSSTNYQVTVVQAAQRIKETYGEEVNNIEDIHKDIVGGGGGHIPTPTSVPTPVPTPTPELPPTFSIASNISAITEVVANSSYTITSADISNIVSTSATTLQVAVNGTQVTLPYTLPTDKVENYNIKYTVRNNAGSNYKERTVKVYKNCNMRNLITNRRSGE